MNNYSWGNPRSRALVQGVYKIDAMVALEAKVEALPQKLRS
jgi:hypothetical protein